MSDPNFIPITKKRQLYNSEEAKRYNDYLKTQLTTRETDITWVNIRTGNKVYFT